MRTIQKKILQWFFFFATIVILLLAYIWFPHFRIMAMVNANTIYDSVEFCYGDNFSIKMLDSRHQMRYVYLPSFANMSEIRVEIDNARVDFVGGDNVVSAYNEGPNICSFETDEEYVMLFYDKNGNEIAKTKVCFLKSANLATLYVSTQSGSFEKIDDDKAYKETAEVSLVSVDGELLFENIGAEVSARGNHTFGYQKKPYQLTLNQEADLLDMGESTAWVLLANTYDLSNIRNKITYDMGIDLGLEGSPRSEFVDLYLNNVYHGTYQLTEKIEYARNRLEYSDLENQNVRLNGSNLNTYRQFSLEDGRYRGYYLPTSPQDISGGYLIEHDYGDKYIEEQSGFRTKSGECYVVCNPKHATYDEVKYIADLFQEIEDAIKSKDGYNKKTGKHYSEYIDVKSWADKYIVEEFTKNTGGGCSSSYFYKLPDSVSEKVFGGPIWDYDKAYGRMGGISSSTNDLNYLTLHSDYTDLFVYLQQHEDFTAMVCYEWKEKFSPYIENVLCKQIDGNSMMLKESLKMNFERFEAMYDYGLNMDTDSECYEKEIEGIKQFVISRKKALDQLWTAEAEICTVKFEGAVGKDQYVSVKKGDTIQAIPGVEETGIENYFWKYQETGKRIEVGMIINHDVSAMAVCE